MKQKKKRLKTYCPCCSLRRQKGVRLQSGETKVTDLQYCKVTLVKEAPTEDVTVDRQPNDYIREPAS